ncbi:MAG: aminodeoxychorismate/anthranilate synthase component II [Planctomycetales bacterium]|nr:aminodeoxychorismate/anthranilate synthase component II [Planctomycetales bacterium]
MILLIDNYDSFVHNLARYFQRLGQVTRVVRNDEMSPKEMAALAPAAVVISPGPCTPAEAGCSVDAVERFAGACPILGVCLGHQAIVAAFGGEIVRAPTPMHGRTAEIGHMGTGLFANLPNPLTVCRYHSLIANRKTLPVALNVTAETDAGIVMAVAHREFPVFGVQFHPEAILTAGGYQLLANFLRYAGLEAVADPWELQRSEGRPAPPLDRPLPTGPVTF